MNIGLIGYGRMGKLTSEAAKIRGHNVINHFNSKDPLVSIGQIENIECLIDFSFPDAVPTSISIAVEAKVNIVVGTTGWDSDILSNYNENLESAEPFVHLKVKLKCLADKKSMIMMNLNATIPHISYHYDEMYIHMDEKLHTYNFKLPLFFFGAFRIRTTGTSELSYESVELYFNENNRIKFTDERLKIDENGAFNSPLVLIPL